MRGISRTFLHPGVFTCKWVALNLMHLSMASVILQWSHPPQNQKIPVPSSHQKSKQQFPYRGLIDLLFVVNRLVGASFNDGDNKDVQGQDTQRGSSHTQLRKLPSSANCLSPAGQDIYTYGMAFGLGGWVPSKIVRPAEDASMSVRLE